MIRALTALRWLAWLLLLAAVGTPLPAGAQTAAPVFSVVQNLPAQTRPWAPMTLASDGLLYGTALGDTGRPAEIFRISAAGAYQQLGTFPGAVNWSPFSALVEGPSGDFYGVSLFGGLDKGNLGTVYRVTRTGKVSVLHYFTAAEGADPVSLVFGSDGHLYGTTLYARGTTERYGTLFRVTLGGVFTTLADFPTVWNEVPGAVLVAGPDGALYGRTYNGITRNGRVFRCTLDGTITSVASMPGNEMLEQVNLTLGSDGSFYGTTAYAGTANLGSVFKVTLAGELTTLASFDGSNGATPCGTLREGSDGRFYGATIADGNTGVFAVTKAGVLTKLAAIPGRFNFGGGGAIGGVAFDGAGVLWGATYAGGTTDGGILFRYGPPLPKPPDPPTTLQILVPPANVSARTGETVRFKVVAQGSGKPALTYQWLKNGKPLANSSVVSGAKTSTLTLSRTGMAAAGSYSVVVAEGSQRVTSRAAELRMTFADDDKDGISNDLDLYPHTAAGDAVNKSGGSIAQLVPRNGKWKNFNQYLGALVKTVNAFRKAGLITAKEGSLIIAKAMVSK